MIRIELPMLPPSIWEMYVGWGQRRRLSPSYAKWRADAGYFIKRPEKPLAIPFTASVCLRRPNKRVDIDNRIKPVLDALQHYGVISDDKLCERITAQWDHGIKAGCVVLIMPFSEALAA
jgi:crossover junction endodeoxyribonuclease RusA